MGKDDYSDTVWLKHAADFPEGLRDHFLKKSLALLKPTLAVGIGYDFF